MNACIENIVKMLHSTTPATQQQSSVEPLQVIHPATLPPLVLPNSESMSQNLFSNLSQPVQSTSSSVLQSVSGVRPSIAFKRGETLKPNFAIKVTKLSYLHLVYFPTCKQSSYKIRLQLNLLYQYMCFKVTDRVRIDNFEYLALSSSYLFEFWTVSHIFILVHF